MLGHIIEDRYVVEAELGEGAMGRVYRARHVKIGRKVAIKVMHPELARVPTIVERFAREARIAARLNHPNVVGVLDVGSSPTKLPLIVLELAPGSSLYSLMQGPMPADRVVDLVRQLLRGLEHAHDAGLVHRDLKPDNILVERRPDGSEIPRIVDFGIAVCNRSEDPIANSRLTDVNTVIGTPSYMSPEQAMAKQVDQRTDLFSLGVIMYELLAGMLPFPGTGAEVAYANASLDVPPIAERAGVLVDPLLEAFARKLLARRLADRFQTAYEALAMLEVIESDRIAAARMLSTPDTDMAGTPAAVALPAVLLPPHCDRLATLTGAQTGGFRSRNSEITRVELRKGIRPARRRARAAIALAVATLTLGVGWSAADHGDAVGAPRLDAAIGTSDLGMSIHGTVLELAPPQEVAAGTATTRSVARPASPSAVAQRTSRVPVARASAPPVTAAVEHVEPPAPDNDTSTLAARYVAVGKALRGAPDELWARYRLIRINDALATEASRRAALVSLGEIERSMTR